MIPLLFKPIDERVRLTRQIQLYAVEHACMLFFLAFLGIIGWLVLLTVAVINTYVQ